MGELEIITFHITEQYNEIEKHFGLLKQHPIKIANTILKEFGED
jgi:hypothetical protein